MNKFHVEVKGSKIADFPYLDVPIQNLTLSEMTIYYGMSERPELDNYNGNVLTIVENSILMNFLRNFEYSIVKLKLNLVNFSSSQLFYDMMENLKALNHLEVSKSQLFITEYPNHSFLPNLKSITISVSTRDFLRLFKAFKTLERIKFIDETQHGYYAEFLFELSNLLEAVPNIKHLTLEGAGTSNFFTQGCNNFKLQKLDAFLVTPSWKHDINNPRLEFLQSQREHLKELNLSTAPYDYDGGKILKFILEEMNLEKFVCGNLKLIENGNRVETIDEVSFTEVQTNYGCELMRQFPGKNLQTFRFFLYMF